jgi:hypothetical protein
LRKERAPREKPQEQKSVEEKNRYGVVVVGVALAQVAKKLFVDEVKPQKALGFAGRRIS